MTAAALEPSNRVVHVSLNETAETLLRSLASAKFGGNVSESVRYLISLYAGHATEQAEQAAADAERYEARRFKAGKLSNELVGYVGGLVRAGLPEDRAFYLSGVSKRQASAWLKKGRLDVAEGRESVAADLVSTLERASAETMLDDVRQYRKVMQNDPRAIMAWLARRYPDQFGERKRSDVNVHHSIAGMIDYDRLTLTEARTLVALLRKASPEPDDASLNTARRPIAELLPGEILETIDLPPEDVTEAPELEAPALDEKPRH